MRDRPISCLIIAVMGLLPLLVFGDSVHSFSRASQVAYRSVLQHVQNVVNIE